MKYDFLDSALLSKLGSLPVEARTPMIGNVAGKHKSPHRGSSVEFAEYRKYVAGDDTRRLDWKAYARSDRFYIKEFEADTNLRAYFVVDASGSMKFAGRGMSKIDYANRIAASLAYLLVNQGDSAGLSLCTDKLHLEVPPSRRPAHLDRLFSTLGSLEPSGETGLVPALHTIAEKSASARSSSSCPTFSPIPRNSPTPSSISATGNTTSASSTCSTRRRSDLNLIGRTALSTSRTARCLSPSQTSSPRNTTPPCESSSPTSATSATTPTPATNSSQPIRRWKACCAASSWGACPNANIDDEFHDPASSFVIRI